MPRTTTIECPGCPPIRALTFDVLGLIKVVEARSRQGRAPNVVERWGEPDSSRCVLAASMNDSESNPLLAVARKSGLIEVLSPLSGDLRVSITSGSHAERQPEDDAIVGLHIFKKQSLELSSRSCTLLTCTTKGHANLRSVEVPTSPQDAISGSSSATWDVCSAGRIVCSKVGGNENYALFGGKGVEVNVWDLDACTKIWNAKSPAKNSLGIFTPTWFTSATFLSKDDHRKVVAGTNSHQVRENLSRSSSLSATRHPPPQPGRTIRPRILVPGHRSHWNVDSVTRLLCDKSYPMAHRISCVTTLRNYSPIPARSSICRRSKLAPARPSWRASSPPNPLSQSHWSETGLAKAGVPITPALVSEALETYWAMFAKGLVGHKKLYIPFDKNASGWTEGALVAFFGKYSGIKDIHFAPSNAEIGKPLQHVDILLREKINGERLMSLEGSAISNARTGWFALAWLDLILKGKEDINVFLFGAGKVGEAIILALDYGAAHRIKSVVVLSQNGKSNRELVEKLQPNVRFQLDAVDARKLLPKADFIITATNAGRPVFNAEEIARHVATLSLGIDDMPGDYFERLVYEGGLIVGDDLAEMEACNADPVALYYSRCGMKLTQHGRLDGIKNYTDVLADAALMEKLKTWEGLANFSPVGLASLDVAVAAHIYEVLQATASV